MSPVQRLLLAIAAPGAHNGNQLRDVFERASDGEDGAVWMAALREALDAGLVELHRGVVSWSAAGYQERELVWGAIERRWR